MARRKRTVIDIILAAPWWISFLIGVACLMVILAKIKPPLVLIALMLPGLFFLISFFSFVTHLFKRLFNKKTGAEKTTRQF
ncbi:MAG: hypothetical protein WCP12_02185 [bacterium]